MKKKLVLIIILIVTLIFLNISTVEGKPKIKDETKFIKVAVESSDDLLKDMGTQENYLKILENYSWVAGSQRYEFIPKETKILNFLKGEITFYNENTDVELSPSYVATMKEISEGLCNRAEETVRPFHFFSLWTIRAKSLLFGAYSNIMQRPHNAQYPLFAGQRQPVQHAEKLATSS